MNTCVQAKNYHLVLKPLRKWPIRESYTTWIIFWSYGGKQNWTVEGSGCHPGGQSQLASLTVGHWKVSEMHRITSRVFQPQMMNLNPSGLQIQEIHGQSSSALPQGSNPTHLKVRASACNWPISSGRYCARLRD